MTQRSQTLAAHMVAAERHNSVTAVEEIMRRSIFELVSANTAGKRCRHCRGDDLEIHE